MVALEVVKTVQQYDYGQSREPDPNPQGTYQFEIISVLWKGSGELRMATFFVQRIDRFCQLLIGIEVVHRGYDWSTHYRIIRHSGTPIITSVNHFNVIC